VYMSRIMLLLQWPHWAVPLRWMSVAAVGLWLHVACQAGHLPPPPPHHHIALNTPVNRCQTLPQPTLQPNHLLLNLHYPPPSTPPPCQVTMATV